VFAYLIDALILEFQSVLFEDLSQVCVENLFIQSLKFTKTFKIAVAPQAEAPLCSTWLK
jgi:hypothetical protein